MEIFQKSPIELKKYLTHKHVCGAVGHWTAKWESKFFNQQSEQNSYI